MQEGCADKLWESPVHTGATAADHTYCLHVDDLSVSLLSFMGCQDVFKARKYIFISVRPPYSTNSLTQDLVALSIRSLADGRVSSAFHFLAVTSDLF